VTYRRVLDSRIGFIAPYTFTQLWTTANYSAIADLHTFQFTVTHALGFTVFTSRILATGLSQSHCNFKSHVMSSLNRLIPILLFLLNHLRMPSQELDPILILAAWDPRYIASRRTQRKTPSSIVKECACSSVAWQQTSCCCVHGGNMFADPLPSNGYACHNINVTLS
jgi:hypothetical protein